MCAYGRYAQDPYLLEDGTLVSRNAVIDVRCNPNTACSDVAQKV